MSSKKIISDICEFVTYGGYEYSKLDLCSKEISKTKTATLSVLFQSEWENQTRHW